ncbi:MarR family winged helix-turn-helix transcriptional regulator [Paraconexibacter sp.]|uniref:MarR family winged helix-turn-helix transcriptional regulator n=1 Tax=Paraconexibacter sp. TaxID=2949640 RepID=UPI00356A6B09
MRGARFDDLRGAHAAALRHLRYLRADAPSRTNNELLVLVALWTSGRDVGFGALADEVGMTAGGLSALVSRLERAGLVLRYRDDPDFRRVMVGLTADALAMVEATAERASSTDAERAPSSPRA